MEMDETVGGYVSLQKAARITGVNYDTLRQRVRLGQIPSKTVGSIYLVHMSDLDDVRVRSYKPRKT